MQSRPDDPPGIAEPDPPKVVATGRPDAPGRARAPGRRKAVVHCTFAGAALLLAACSLAPPGALPKLPPREVVRPDSLAITSTAADNREVSFTNKRSAHYSTQTHRNDNAEYAGFRGLNIAQRRIFAGYATAVAGEVLDPALALATVHPDRLERRWPGGIVETLRLVDDADVVEVEVTGTDLPVSVQPLGAGVEPVAVAAGYVTYTTMAAPGQLIAVGRSDTRTLLAVIPSGADPAAALSEAFARADLRRQSRIGRLQQLLNGERYLWTSDPRRTEALRWLGLTLDQLVTRQRGDGIYAGLPWFDEYWGRDSFIALPGALLVTGRFETARAVLTSFARFQDLDPASRFYGRVPNIVRPDDLDYHTVDGTPRFVIALEDYVRYSGDRSIVAELFPNVRASIEGALARWTDAQGFLTHADNESWMDARRAADLVPYSPRGNRANDVQALWYRQLLAGARFAGLVGDADAARRWTDAARRVRGSFQRAFTSPDHDFLADRLRPDGSADFSLRPNQFYAFDLLDDPARIARATRAAWENLVFPWGVASLAPGEPFFHPYHLAWDRYHKDEAYHNGTVWLWNNGIAMQRMIELGQVAPAWTLFENMNRQALERGVAGGLGENMDACPHPGEPWPRLTGTYLQAWSNSEQLRVWYQHFLGVRPDMTAGSVTIAPRMPPGFGAVDFSARLGDGSIRGVYREAGAETGLDWVLAGTTVTLLLDLPGFPVQRVVLEAGERLNARLHPGGPLRIAVSDAAGRERLRRDVPADMDRVAAQDKLAHILGNLRFAVPPAATADRPLARSTLTLEPVYSRPMFPPRPAP